MGVGYLLQLNEAKERRPGGVEKIADEREMGVVYYHLNYKDLAIDLGGRGMGAVEHSVGGNVVVKGEAGQTYPRPHHCLDAWVSQGAWDSGRN